MGRGPPRVGIETEAAAQLGGLRAVHDVEVEAELFVHFLLPLLSERGGREDENALDAPLEDQFGKDKAGLDGFAQADVIGEEQAHTRHAHGLEEGDHLVVFNLDGTMEGGGKGQPGKRAVIAVGIGERVDGPPAGGAL